MKILVDADDLRLLVERNPATESMMQRWNVVQAKGRLADALEAGPTDRLAAASDPGVVAIVLARDINKEPYMGRYGVKERSLFLRSSLERQHGITSTEDQCQVLLDAVAAWDEDAREHYGTDTHLAIRARLDAAVTAIVGEQPHPLRYEGMGNYTCRVDGTPTGGWPCPNGPDRVPMDPATGMPEEQP